MVDLSDLHILITRPQDQARVSAQAFTAAGASVTCQAFLSIEPLTDANSEQAIKDRILRLNEYQKIIFVSQNAVRYGAKWLDQLWPQLPQGLKFFAVGETTAKQLENALSHLDATVIAPTQAMNSEALLALPQLQRVKAEKILIFRGQGGHPLMSEILQQRGAQVYYCELYRRQIPDTIDLHALRNFSKTHLQVLTVVLSCETLSNLCTHLSEHAESFLRWLKNQTLLVPGERVAAQAKAFDFKTIIVADNATQDSILGAIHDWRSKQ